MSGEDICDVPRRWRRWLRSRLRSVGRLAPRKARVRS